MTAASVAITDRHHYKFVELPIEGRGYRDLLVVIATIKGCGFTILQRFTYKIM